MTMISKSLNNSFNDKIIEYLKCSLLSCIFTFLFFNIAYADMYADIENIQKTSQQVTFFRKKLDTDYKIQANRTIIEQDLKNLNQARKAWIQARLTYTENCKNNGNCNANNFQFGATTCPSGMHFSSDANAPACIDNTLCPGSMTKAACLNKGLQEGWITQGDSGVQRCPSGMHASSDATEAACIDDKLCPGSMTKAACLSKGLQEGWITRANQ